MNEFIVLLLLISHPYFFQPSSRIALVSQISLLSYEGNLSLIQQDCRKKCGWAGLAIKSWTRLGVITFCNLHFILASRYCTKSSMPTESMPIVPVHMFFYDPVVLELA